MGLNGLDVKNAMVGKCCIETSIVIEIEALFVHVHDHVRSKCIHSSKWFDRMLTFPRLMTPVSSF